MTVVRGTPDGTGRRIAIVASRFNERITARLVEGATDGLASCGVDPAAIDVVWVPGAFEIAAVAQRLARGGHHDGLICVGAVIRGETAHFELVAGEAARGVAEVARTTGVPVMFEVLAADSVAIAEARAGGEHGNRGRDAARAVLETIAVGEALGSLGEEAR
jgi:6,7-dimethyl-8-ribityllumazine synthase